MLLTIGSIAAYRLYFRPSDAATRVTSLAVLPCRALAERERIGFLEVGIADSIIIALSNARSFACGRHRQFFSIRGVTSTRAPSGRRLA